MNQVLIFLKKEHIHDISIQSKSGTEYYLLSDIISEYAKTQDTDFRCGQGDNRCNCKTPEECGYIEMARKIKAQNIRVDSLEEEIYKKDVQIKKLEDKIKSQNEWWDVAKKNGNERIDYLVETVKQLQKDDEAKAEQIKGLEDLIFMMSFHIPHENEKWDKIESLTPTRRNKH